MSTQLEKRIATFARWRAEMISGIESYKSWLDANGYADIQQSLRIYDLVESLKQDRMTLAFIAEFSRGKTELINAMFFSDFKQRLLPSDVGRTTMCPTELFHDPEDEPYVRLLPIETRKRNESIAALKRKPIEWIKVRLEIGSAEEMAKAMHSLAETKIVTRDEALALGLYDNANPEATTVVMKDPDRIEVPAWRHALVNYPHVLLKSGLVVLDTPGLNALGTEPELTMSMIPNAHAVLFLLAMDTGVTRSDMDLWQKYVQHRVPRKLAVLNKVDLMWDDLKGPAEIEASIERQLDQTAHLLGLPRSHVLAISAQKALVARVRGDPGLLERTGVERLEQLIAAEIIPAKQEILRSAVSHEIGAMVDSSRQAIIAQFVSARDEYRQVAELSGKNRGVAQAMVQRLESDRAGYLASVAKYRAAHDTLTQQGNALLGNLSDETLERLVNTDRKFIEDAWTTAGLVKNMQGLFDHFTAQSDRILRFAGEIQALVEQTYAEFQEKFGFAAVQRAGLNLEKHALAMHNLKQTAVEFCHDPVSIMTEKHFLVRRFYDSLVGEARRIFEMTRVDTEAWLRGALNPLNTALKEHEVQLGKRVENLKKMRDNLQSVGDRAKYLERQMQTLKAQHDVLAGIRTNLESPATPEQTVREGTVPTPPAQAA